MMELFEKLFIARKLLSLKQKEAAELSGVKQSIISILERGERDTVPYEYFRFFYQKGIDINWFYDEEDSLNNVFQSNKNKQLENAVFKLNENNNSENQELHLPEILSLKNVGNLDKVLNELLSEIKHLNVKLEN